MKSKQLAQAKLINIIVSAGWYHSDIRERKIYLLQLNLQVARSLLICVALQSMSNPGDPRPRMFYTGRESGKLREVLQ